MSNVYADGSDASNLSAGNVVTCSFYTSGSDDYPSSNSNSELYVCSVSGSSAVLMDKTEGVQFNADVSTLTYVSDS